MSWNKITISTRTEVVDFFGGMEDLRLLHISDIHLWYSTGILHELTAIITNTRPEMLMLTGDYYDLPAGARNFRTFLSGVSVKQPVIFIPGNHDMIYGQRTFSTFAAVPNCFCVDNSVFSYQSRSGRGYNITSWKNRSRLPDSKRATNIVLVHNPEDIRENELLNIDLILAGHLHGGQLIFFRTKNHNHFPGALMYRYCTDRKQIGNTTLIVSRGLGDTFPMRINCPKEVVDITIV